MNHIQADLVDARGRIIASRAVHECEFRVRADPFRVVLEDLRMTVERKGIAPFSMALDGVPVKGRVVADSAKMIPGDTVMIDELVLRMSL